MYEIKVENKAVIDAIQRLQHGAENPRPAFLAIGENLVESTKLRFETSTTPNGVAWKPNSPVTLKRKKGTKPLLGETRLLSNTINYAYDGHTLIVGSPMEYAAVQQFGAKMGEFGRYSQIGRVRKYGLNTFKGSAGTKNGFPLPWGDIPARPFLGISAEDEAMINNVISDYLMTLV